MNLFKAFHQNISIYGEETRDYPYHKKVFALSAVMSPLCEALLEIWSMTC